MTVKNAIDKKAIRARYAEEREKRLRQDGSDQYLRLAGTSLAHYVDDPYMPVVEREPVTDHVDVALVGGGFAGLITGARLKEAGVEKIRIIDKTGDLLRIHLQSTVCPGRLSDGIEGWNRGGWLYGCVGQSAHKLLPHLQLRWVEGAGCKSMANIGHR